MNLLIVTQKVDKNDPVLGFFHGWIRELSGHFEKLTVVCLQKGEFDLPLNVEVISLGKEAGASHLDMVLRFYGVVFSKKNSYDSVFVHMNEEYVLLAGLIWKMMGKKVLMWRNHPEGNWKTRMAVGMSDRVFCTSTFSYTAGFKKTRIMPVGIDTDLFNEDISAERNPGSVLFISRMSPIKKVDILLSALKIIKEKGESFTAQIYGDALPKDTVYLQSLKDFVKKNELTESVFFHPAIPNTDTPKIYSGNSVFVNLTGNGSFDKTIFEAIACGCMPIVANQDLTGKIPDEYITDGTPEDLADKIVALLKRNSNPDKNALRNMVEMEHGLKKLASAIAEECK